MSLRYYEYNIPPPPSPLGRVVLPRGDYPCVPTSVFRHPPRETESTERPPPPRPRAV